MDEIKNGYFKYLQPCQKLQEVLYMQLSKRKMKLHVPTRVAADYGVTGTKTLCKTVHHDFTSGANFKLISCWGERLNKSTIYWFSSQMTEQ